jgi:hypothetical protein
MKKIESQITTSSLDQNSKPISCCIHRESKRFFYSVVFLSLSIMVVSNAFAQTPTHVDNVLIQGGDGGSDILVVERVGIGKIMLNSAGYDTKMVFDAANINRFSFGIDKQNDGLAIASGKPAYFKDVAPYFFMKRSDGWLGLGTRSPQRQLHVKSQSSGLSTGYSLTGGIDIESNNITGINILSPNSGHGRIYFGVPVSKTVGSVEYKHNATASSGYMKFRAGNADRMFIKGNGQVGVGTSAIPSGYKFAVAGKAIMEEVKVEASPWPDYVFSSDYSLMSLQELQDFINTNGHLPEVPDAETVEEEGIALGEMNALLLKKIEELTLYLIEIKEENQNLKEEVLLNQQYFEQQIDKLFAKIEMLEQ